MIQWAVSTEGVLTGHTRASNSSSTSADYGGSETLFGGGRTTFNTASGSVTYTFFSSRDSSGTTSSFSSFTSYNIYSSFTEFATIVSNSSTSTITDSGSYSTSGATVTTESASGLLTTMASQTSTTQTVVAYKTTTYETTTSTSVWTTSQAQSTGPVTFSQTPSTTNIWATSIQSSQSTKDTTTTVNGIMVASATALVIQAKTGEPNAEIIYYASSVLSWSEINAASAIAQTATRVTLANIYSTTSASKNTVQINVDSNGISSVVNVPSFSWSSPSSSYSFELATSRTTSASTTVVSNSIILPNQTEIRTGQILTTLTTSFFSSLWTSYSNSCIGEDSTTTAFQQIAISSRAAGLSWLGNLSWNIARTTTVSRLVTTSTIAGCVKTNANGASGFTAEQNIPLVLPPQPTTSIVGNVAQVKFVPVFAQIATNRGQWFTIASSTFSNASYANLSRSFGKTILPSEISGESYGSSRITYTSQNGQQTTTTTAALGVDGQSTTTALVPEFGIIGGSPNISETFVYGASADGAYKNRIGGNTTSFDAGATTFTQSRPISCFEPITALVPLAGTGSTAVFPLYWTAPRNSTALPPDMV